MTVKPCLQYPGAKVGMASRIAALFPTHGSYLEPYCGSAAVLLAKDPVPVETISDVNGQLVNFYRVLRDPNTRHRLVDALTYTPYARAEHRAAVDDPGLDPVERARRYFVRTNQGYVGGDGRGGWTCTLKASSGHSNASKWNNYRTRLSMVAERLQSVQIEETEGVGMVAKAAQAHDARLAVYLDPPYPEGTRNGVRYTFDDKPTERMHEVMLMLACELRGPAVISSYPNDLYEKVLGEAGWREYRATVKASGQSGRGRTAVRTEVLWANPQCVDAVPRDFHLVTMADMNGDPVDVVAPDSVDGPPELGPVG